MDVLQLKAQSEELFSKRENILDLWQQISDLFYPERGIFTVTRSLGTEYADHLMSGFPSMARRDLANSIASMLRRDKWFHLGTSDGKIEEDDAEAKRYLEWRRDRMYQLMYDRRTNFVVAAGNADHDYVAYGQSVLSVEVYQYQHLLIRTWHLKDCAWSQNALQQVDTMHVRHKMRARDIEKWFPKCDERVGRMCREGKGLEEIDCEWAVYPIEDGQWMSVHWDRRFDKIMEERIIKVFPFVVPRWQTVTGSPYAYSPAVMTAFPDARLLQAMTLTLLEAGEMAVRPPLIGVQDVLRSDVKYVSGGITWVSEEYDERTGDPLRPIKQDRGGFPAAFRIEDTVRAAIAESFFLPKLNLPIQGEMTAYEVQERIKEYVRNAYPIFSPTEYQYNAPLCETINAVLEQNRAFGTYVPRALAGMAFDFKFESPIQDAHEREKVEMFRTAVQLLTEAVELDPDIVAVADLKTAFKGAMSGMGSPAEWTRKKEEMESLIEQSHAMIQEQQQVEQLGQVAQAAKAAA